MIQVFRRKILESFKRACSVKRQDRLSDVKGQVGLVLVLLAAIGLIFYAAVYNLNKASGTKIQTMIAAESSASFMASFMASYAQKLSVENLKGKIKYCDTTSLLARLIKLYFFIMIAVVCIVTGQIWAAIVIVAYAWSAVIIDAFLIQPTLTKKWNSEMKKISTIEGQLIEYGVQTALMKAVSDPVGLPDLTDDDADTIFGWKNPAVISDGAKDYTSRFGYYYSLRLNNPRASPPNPTDTAVLKEFSSQLMDFLYYRDQEDEDPANGVPDPDVWGIHDTACDHIGGHSVCACNSAGFLISAATAPAECDPCCVPPRAACCDITGCPDPAECSGASPPECCASCSEPPSGDTDPSCAFSGVDPSLCPSGPTTPCASRSYMGSNYPYVFDPFYEDTTNSILSFREQIGRDDESPQYQVNPAAPNWHERAGIDASTQQTQRTSPPAPADIDTTELSTQDPGYWYQIQDTTGFYSGDSYDPGFYELFYFIEDIKVELSGMSDYSGFSCYWKDGACDGVLNGTTRNEMGIYATLGLTPLTLTAPYNGLSGDAEVKDLGAGGFPDIVPAPAGIFLDYDPYCISINKLYCLCGDDYPYGWKRGSDRFCTTTPEYHTSCPKHETCQDSPTGDEGDIYPEDRDCLCGEGAAWDKKFFPRDILEDFYYGIPELMNWALDFTSGVASRAVSMQKAMDSWYDEIAAWIEPACGVACDVGDPACCPGSYNKSLDAGYLYQWRDELEAFYDALNNWIYPEQTDAYIMSADCLGSNSAWCVPDVQMGINQYGIFECRGVTEQEQSLFDVNENGVRGDLMDVVACLDYNVNDVKGFMDPYSGATRFPSGDKEKFQACADYCGPWACAQLPRSLVVLNSLLPKEAHLASLSWSDYELFVYCIESQSYTQCAERCDPSVLPLATYSIDPTNYIAPDAGILAAEKEWSKLKTICQWDEQYQATLICSADTQDITCTTPVATFETCRDSFSTGSCEAILTGAGPETTYRSDIFAAIPGADNTTGSCQIDMDSNAQIDLVEWAQRSADAADNLVKKLNQRLNFLKQLLIHGLRVWRAVGEGVDRIDEFLDNNTDFNVGPLGNNQMYTDNESILGENLDIAEEDRYHFPEKERDVEWTKEGLVGLDAVNVYEKYSVDSPAELLVALRYAADDEEEKDSTSVAVYVWRDEDLPAGKLRADGTGQGYAHAVKVEVRVPKRCNNACGLNGAPEGRWPWIKTKSKRWGTKRCFYLAGYVGMVKARVIRWDEPKDTTHAFRFANNVPIWGMRLAHPDGSPGYVGGIFNDDSDCYKQIDEVLLGISKEVSDNGGTETLHHAFMLNKVPYQTGAEADPAYDACWTAVHQNMLQQGVHSESCARYQWEGGSHGDMGIRFVPCDRNFLEGAN